MTDLLNLFKSPIALLSHSSHSSPSLPLSPYLSVLSLNSRVAPTAHWSWGGKGEMDSGMGKGVKREVRASGMGEQLRIFFGMQKQVVLNKILLIAAFMLVLNWLATIQGMTLVTLILLISSELFSGVILPFAHPIATNNIHAVQPLIYCALFYILLKWAAGMESTQIEWPLAFISIVATLGFSFLKFYQSFFRISTRIIASDAVRQKKIVKKLLIFLKYAIHRVRMMLGICKYLVISISVLSIGVIASLHYCGKYSIQFFLPTYLFFSIPIFISLQIFIDFISYLNNIMTMDLKLSMIMKDKIPMYLNLLRLENSSNNQIVQQQCLKCIYLKIYMNQGFLTTQTFKSTIYNTYMDIFNQYASVQLDKLSASFSDFLITAKNNDKIIKQQKTMVQDLLIYFKKIIAFISTEWMVVKVVSLLSALNFLFLTIMKVESGSEDQEIRVSGRVLSLVKGIREKLSECTERVSLSAYTRGELMSLYVNFSSYEYWIQANNK